MAAGAKRAAGKRQVGIRELRQNLSVHLERVKRGERLEVTEHGRPVALLVPLPPQQDGLERMIAEGRATRPTKSWTDMPPPIELPEGSRSLSEVLRGMRDEERW